MPGWRPPISGLLADSNSGGNVVRALIGDGRPDELTQKIDPDRRLALDFYRSR
ncbi:hypothetical protein RGCCGE502_16660 [Rhizobium grahamii CCGE 502]|uniref:Uncharacterized protein n=1 Tax=Rhizobium grahamii CCGE 502 TaxID=990285 RepID=S3HEQ8_9HYPH|nr:hypothetical protein RGCCGE502_16660 [Rhizobium grahamii CCGE 502]